MATTGLTKQTTPARSVYDGSGEFQVSSGSVELKSNAGDHVEYDVPEGETWKVVWTMHVIVL